MKKLILILMLFVSPLLAQYSLKIALPTSGLSSVIKFAKYPHSDLGADEVTGITVTEPGSAKTYLATGFTTYQYVTLWINGVKQTWFDSVEVGSITAFISSNYVTLNTAQTIASNKTVTGTFTVSGNTFLYSPRIHTSGTEYVNNTLSFDNSLVFKKYLTSNYLDTTVFYNSGDGFIRLRGEFKLGHESDGSGPFNFNPSHFLWGDDKLSLNTTFNVMDTSVIYNAGGGKFRFTSGNKLYGPSNSTSPFEINTAQFTWSSDKLNLSGSILSPDSMRYFKLSIGRDTTWTVLGEPVTKPRSITLKKDNYATPTYVNVPDWEWNYESRDESGALLATGKYAAINDVWEVDKVNDITLGTSNTKLDSIQLGPGTYSIDFGANYNFDAASFGSAPTSSDTIAIELNKGSGVGNILKNNIFVTRQYLADVNYNQLGVLSWKARVTLTGVTWIYLVGKRLNTETNLGHKIYRDYILAERIY
jgi:hypothetical protein